MRQVHQGRTARTACLRACNLRRRRRPQCGSQFRSSETVTPASRADSKELPLPPKSMASENHTSARSKCRVPSQRARDRDRQRPALHSPAGNSRNAGARCRRSGRSRCRWDARHRAPDAPRCRAAVSVRSSRSPRPSAPDLAAKATRAPSAAAAKALFAPPPPMVSTIDSTEVSPSVKQMLARRRRARSSRRG